MEEFDRIIKSKIDSLNEVPGVVFNEERVWKRIKSNWTGGIFFFLGLLFLLSGLIIVFLPKNEVQRKIDEYSQVEQSCPEVLIDSNITQTRKKVLYKNLDIASEDSINEIEIKTRKETTIPVDQSQSIYPMEKLVQEQSTLTPTLVDNQVISRVKEISMSLGKENQTVGVTHLHKLNDRLSLTYGIQFNRTLNQSFRKRENMFRPIAINQIQIPLGLRYDFSSMEKKFKPYLNTGFSNSFLLSSNSGISEYNMRFELDMGLDFRIFSTKDGKNGYLRFRLPVYNKDIINKGFYRPSFYDLLKK